MSEATDLDEGSVVEYSLAELGFVLVFVLLLLSGWEINTNAANLEKEEESRAELQRQLEAEKQEMATLKALIAWLPPDATEFPDDFMFVDKKDYLALQAKADDAEQVIETIAQTLQNLEPSMLYAIADMASSAETPPDDPLIVSENDQRELEEKLNRLERENALMSEKLASIAIVQDASSSDGDKVVKVGTIGFCTYAPPTKGSGKVYGKSVALGTLLVEEDGITLIAKNSAIQSGTFVDIAGENYDTALVSKALDEFSLNQKLSPRQFQNIGARFVGIGDLPSDKRVACRFGMDYHVPIYSKKSAAMLKNILEGSFYKNTEVSDKNFAKQFPDYDFTQKQKDADRPAGRQAATRKKSPTSESTAASRATLESEGDKPRKLKTSPKLLAKSMPMFPRAAESRGMQGVVEISYKVSTNGRPSDIKIIREEPPGYGFGEASLTALEKYKFEPATEDGSPVMSEPQKLRFKF